MQPGKLESYRFIHIAAHGLLNENKPALSGILLSAGKDHPDDNVLTMGEIFNIRTKADLVVLSACNTGLGKIVNGEGVVGLIRTWLYAGASAVAASLWPVDDRSTAGLMKEFYTNIKHNMNVGRALREAKLMLIRSGTGEHLSYDYPYYWAGFILSGTE